MLDLYGPCHYCQGLLQSPRSSTNLLLDRSMAPSSRKNLSAPILLIAVMAAAAWMHAADACNQHLSGNYKGACWSWFDDDKCANICWDENTDNIHGFCAFFQCWCETRCAAAETFAAASAPIPS